MNPLSPKSDQHQISPNSINTLIRREGNENQGHNQQTDFEGWWKKSLSDA